MEGMIQNLTLKIDSLIKAPLPNGGVRTNGDLI